jgi:hypothetical protein
MTKGRVTGRAECFEIKIVKTSQLYHALIFASMSLLNPALEKAYSLKRILSTIGLHQPLDGIPIKYKL